MIVAAKLIIDEQAQDISIDPAVSQLYRDIPPEAGFDWQSKDQIYNAPFRSTFHLTMGMQIIPRNDEGTNRRSALQTCSFSEFLDMDKTYPEKINLRRRIIEEQGKNVIDCAPVATSAVFELYEWTIGNYLPKRYPSMFALVTTEKNTYVLNKVLNEQIPLVPLPSSAHECLTILASHVDTDFNILMPYADPNEQNPKRAEPTPTPDHPYHLHAYAFCFPSGFSMPHKMGLSLANIHIPVPGYAQKLQMSMDRFFTTLPFGKIAKRANWAVQQDSTYFKISGNHGYTKLAPQTFAPPKHEPSEEELKQWAEDAEKVVPETCVLRSERQTLHRLEKTGALVFAFKTYMYPLPEVKAAGLGVEMADAAEGLWKGSVPAIAVYKRGVVWARKVVDYLRA